MRLINWVRDVILDHQGKPRAATSITRVEDCVPALRRYAIALLRSRDQADDLVHDCLVNAISKLHTRRDNADMRAWLFAILHNLFISQRRRSKIRPDTMELNEAHSNVASHPANQDDRLQWRDVLRGLERLPEEQRAVILLVGVEDMSYAETASILDIPIGTVMSRLARGRERLRQYTESVVPPASRRVQ